MATIKKKAIRKKKVSGVKKTVAVAHKKRKRISSAISIGKIGSAAKTMGKIDKLEAMRKKEKRREMRDIIQLEINHQHDVLDKLKKEYKKL